MSVKILKRFFWVIVVVAVYFSGWKMVRSSITSSLIIPQIEAAADHCNSSAGYEQVSNTAVLVSLQDNNGEPQTYRFNAPAGFYLLLALVLLFLKKADRKWFGMILGYHAIFTTLLVSTFYIGLCYLPILLNLSAAGNSYFTPFFTFFVLLNIIFPDFVDTISRKSGSSQN